MSQVVKARLAFVTAATAFAPVPYLSQAAHLLEEINSLIQHVKGVRSRMKNLASCLEILIQGLEGKLRASQRLMPSTRKGIDELEKLLQNIRDCALDFAAQGFFSLALMRSEAHSIIQGYHGKVMATPAALNIDIHLANQELLMSHEDARVHDHHEILAHIKSLQNNQEKLIEELHEANRSSSPPIDPAHLYERLADCPEYRPKREILQDVIHRTSPLYPALTFPAPGLSEPLEGCFNSMPNKPTLPLDGPPPQLYTLGWIRFHLRQMRPHTIVPKPVHDGEKPTPPPSYEPYSLEYDRRSYEFDFVRAAVQAWDWNALESKAAGTNSHMPVAQIISEEAEEFLSEVIHYFHWVSMSYGQ